MSTQNLTWKMGCGSDVVAVWIRVEKAVLGITVGYQLVGYQVIIDRFEVFVVVFGAKLPIVFSFSKLKTCFFNLTFLNSNMS